MAKKDIDFELYAHIRNQTVSICQPLELEDYVVQPVAEVSPPKWHLAHTTWFFENFILNHFVKEYQKFDPDFDELFNSYYKSCGKHWLQAKRGILSRPTVKQVLDYRDYVDGHMRQLLEVTHQQDKDISMLTEVGLHHEQQHQELLYMDIKYILAVNPGLPVYDKSPLPKAGAVAMTWADIEPGVYHIGCDSNEFTYDNERPAHQYYQHSCAIANRLITNGEFLQFIEDKGYENPLLWLSDGWNCVYENQISGPLYWHKNDDQWFEYTLHGDRQLDLTSPVCHISYYEASAFARWYGARLPTEQEFEIHTKSCSKNADFESSRFLHPTQTDINARQLWAWTQSPYVPYPGYQSFTGALGEYNGKFMCNQQVLRGSCLATPVHHYRPSYRNFYFPQQNWMFSGICLAKDK